MTGNQSESVCPSARLSADLSVYLYACLPAVRSNDLLLGGQLPLPIYSSFSNLLTRSVDPRATITD